MSISLQSNGTTSCCLTSCRPHVETNKPSVVSPSVLWKENIQTFTFSLSGHDGRSLLILSETNPQLSLQIKTLFMNETTYLWGSATVLRDMLVVVWLVDNKHQSSWSETHIINPSIAEGVGCMIGWIDSLLIVCPGQLTRLSGLYIKWRM